MIQFEPATASLPDDRDYIHKQIYFTFPQRLDLRKDRFALENQDAIGACVANTLSGDFELFLKRAGRPIHLSRMWIYYQMRKLAGRLGQEGGSPRDALKICKSLGVPPEDVYPYVLSWQDQEPWAEVYAAAKDHTVLRYASIGFQPYGGLAYVDTIKSALCEGYPVIFCMPVTASFLNVSGPLDRQWYYPYGTTGHPSIGSHCMYIVGFTEVGFIVQSSWPDWGDEQGCAIVPYAEAANFTEAWVAYGFDGAGELRAPGIYCTRNKGGVSAQIVPTANEDGRTLNVWIVARLNGLAYVKNPTGSEKPMRLFDTAKPDYTPTAQHHFDGALDINITDDDPKMYPGAEVIVGYGQSAFDWKFSTVCTL